MVIFGNVGFSILKELGFQFVLCGVLFSTLMLLDGRCDVEATKIWFIVVLGRIGHSVGGVVLWALSFYGALLWNWLGWWYVVVNIFSSVDWAYVVY